MNTYANLYCSQSFDEIFLLENDPDWKILYNAIINISNEKFHIDATNATIGEKVYRFSNSQYEGNADYYGASVVNQDYNKYPRTKTGSASSLSCIIGCCSSIIGCCSCCAVILISTCLNRTG